MNAVPGRLAAGCLVLVAGCGPADDPAGPSPGPLPSVSASPIFLEGTVREGVEAGCLVLRSGEETYLLLGPAVGDLDAGDRVRVHGTPRPEVATSCMEGVPFDVASIEPRS